MARHGSREAPDSYIPHMNSPRILLAMLAGFAACSGLAAAPSRPAADLEIRVTPKPKDPRMNIPSTAVATFAGGCFWCTEATFLDLEGVRSAVSGYAGGHDPKPTYESVGTGRTGHAEAVQVTYDPAKVSYATLLEFYWRHIDPSDLGGQFADRGSQYRPVIFVHNAEQRRLAEESKARLAASGKIPGGVKVPVEDFRNFYPAEDYHQNYCKLNPERYKRYKEGSGRAGYIRNVWGDAPAPRVPVTPDNDGVENAVPGGAGSPRELCDLSSLSDAELRARLSPEQYEITRRNGTERPFANAYWNNKREGLYVDVVSGEPLFSSRDKFDSGTGWPSFTKPVPGAEVREHTDRSHGMVRTEVRSGRADSHLGHLFPDGPAPTGLRYCINSAALRFIPREDLEREGYGEYVGLFEGK